MSKKFNQRVKMLRAMTKKFNIYANGEWIVDIDYEYKRDDYVALIYAIPENQIEVLRNIETSKRERESEKDIIYCAQEILKSCSLQKHVVDFEETTTCNIRCYIFVLDI